MEDKNVSKEYVDSQLQEPKIGEAITEEREGIEVPLEETGILNSFEDDKGPVELAGDEIGKINEEQKRINEESDEELMKVSEEELRKMKWESEIPSEFNATLNDLLVASEIDEERIKTIAKATVDAIENNPDKLFLTDEEIKELELWGLVTEDICKAILIQVPEDKTEEEIKLEVCKQMISESYISVSYLTNPDNIKDVQDKIFNKRVSENPEAMKAIHRKIILLYENPETDPKLKEQIEDDYRIVKQEYRDTLLFIDRLSRFSGIIKRMSEAKKKEHSIESYKILEYIYKDVKLKQDISSLVKVIDESFNWFITYSDDMGNKNYPINFHTVKNIPMYIFIGLSREKLLLRYYSAAFFDFAVKLYTLIDKIFKSEEIVKYMEDNKTTKKELLEKVPEDFKVLLLDNEHFKYFNNIMIHCMHKFVWDSLPINRKK